MIVHSKCIKVEKILRIIYLISLSLYLFAKGYAVFAADVRIAPRHDRQCSLYAQLYIYCK